MNHWAAGDESFRKDPPNAALVLRDSSGKSEVYAMEIWNPQYDAGSGTLAYDIRELDSGVPVTAGHAPAHRAREAPTRFSDATLFIDPSEAVCQMLYGESCGVAVCDPLAVFVFNRAQCLAEANGTAPPPTPPPTCAAGSTPENPGNGWVCVAQTPSSFSCPPPCFAVPPGTLVPPPPVLPQNTWRCADGTFPMKPCWAWLNSQHG